MLDPCFKVLHIVENLVVRRDAIRLASKYDFKVVILLLMVCFDKLNPIMNTSIVMVVDVVSPRFEKNMLGVGALIEESS
jgi:hypothetical protein